MSERDDDNWAADGVPKPSDVHNEIAHLLALHRAESEKSLRAQIADLEAEIARLKTPECVLGEAERLFLGQEQICICLTISDDAVEMIDDRCDSFRYRSLVHAYADLVAHKKLLEAK